MPAKVDTSKRYVCRWCEAQFILPTFLASHVRDMHPVTVEERQDIINIWLNANKPTVNFVTTQTPRSQGTVANIIRQYRIEHPVDLEDATSERGYVTLASLVDAPHLVETTEFNPLDYVIAFEKRVAWFHERVATIEREKNERIAFLEQQNKVLNDRVLEISRECTSIKLQARQGNVESVLRHSPLRTDVD